MSVVSGVTLLTSVTEEKETFDAINNWLFERGYIKGMAPVEDNYGGSKHPQQLAHGAGLNYLEEDAFADFVIGLPWEYPERVVLVIQPEEGDTRVFRPLY